MLFHFALLIIFVVPVHVLFTFILLYCCSIIVHVVHVLLIIILCCGILWHIVSLLLNYYICAVYYVKDLYENRKADTALLIQVKFIYLSTVSYTHLTLPTIYSV